MNGRKRAFFIVNTSECVVLGGSGGGVYITDPEAKLTRKAGDE